MKKNRSVLWSCVLLFAILFGLFTETYASEAVNKKTAERIQHEMSLRGMTGDIQIYPLMNEQGRIEYYLGTCESGYIILTKDTFVYCESGEGNPYAACLNKTKYYGGFASYYTKSDNKMFFDILSGENTDTMRNSIPVGYIEKESTNKETLNSRELEPEPIILPNASLYLQVKAFGNNTDNTCSAVATGIALNYLTLKTGKSFVPSNMRSENLTGVYAPGNMSQTYPKAHSLHRYLVDTCGMGAASFAYGVSNPFATYVNNKVNSSYGLTMSWTNYLPNANRVKESLNANKPAMITTFLAGQFSWHTMVVYGYRNVNGTDEVLVHTGWYGSSWLNKISNSTYYHHKHVWIPFSYAQYLYTFNYN